MTACLSCRTNTFEQGACCDWRGLFPVARQTRYERLKTQSRSHMNADGPKVAVDATGTVRRAEGGGVIEEITDDTMTATMC